LVIAQLFSYGSNEIKYDKTFSLFFIEATTKNINSGKEALINYYSMIRLVSLQHM